MFYQILLELCKKKGVKPTPLIKSLGFSAGNLKRWEQGSTINSDILMALSKHFGVSIDYLLLGVEPTQSEPKQELTKEQIKIWDYYARLEEEDKDYIKGEMVRLYKENQQSINQRQNVAK